MEPRSLGESLRHLFTRVLFAAEPDRDTRIRLVPFLVVLLLPAAVLYPTLGFHLLEPDEGRYAQIPKEMLVNNSWVVPTLQGEPYLDKPPLLYWLVALSYHAFGISPAAARLVPALCVHLTILAIYLIGRRSVGQRAAFWAALLLSVAPGFVSVARLLLLDGLLTLFVALSVLCGFEAVRTGRFRPGWWLASALASGLGFLTKGPISEVLLFVPLWMYGFLAQPGEPRPSGRGWKVHETPTPSLTVVVRPARVRWYWYGIFIAIVVAVNVPWYVAMYRQQPQFLGYFFWQHNVMRFLQPFDHLQPIWYYAPILLAGLLPGTILLGAYLWRMVHRGDGAHCVPATSAGGFWLLAGAWCVLFFSCSGSKLPTYILPAYPFLCLAIGEFVARSRWDRAGSTRIMVAAAAALVLFAHHYAMPWYAQERSPFGRPELVERYVDDPETAVVCFPRNCDSVAFYTDRADLRNVRTKDVNQMFVDCHHRPRTVILFTHRESFAGFKSTLPPSLAIVESQTLRRGYGNAILDRLFGSTPWGLCDVAVVKPLYQVPPAE
jgi:4-amino-4-deoxy-L-arabinose transferase-like glycosyltransferase